MGKNETNASQGNSKSSEHSLEIRGLTLDISFIVKMDYQDISKELMEKLLKEIGKTAVNQVKSKVEK
jgi:hypothetical protein